MTFEEKVRSMTGKEIMQAMIDGLNKPWLTVEMSTYGSSSETKLFGIFSKTVCFGCAATNTICEIVQKKFTGKNINSFEFRAESINSDQGFLDSFESALNDLRRGRIDWYNIGAENENFNTIRVLDNFELPVLETDNYKELLPIYQQYCDKL